MNDINQDNKDIKKVGSKDISKFVELLVSDYLRSSNCMKTFDATVTDFSKKKSILFQGNENELFTKATQDKKQFTKYQKKSTLEYLVDQHQEEYKTKLKTKIRYKEDGKSSHLRRRNSLDTEDEAEEEMKEWSSSDIEKLLQVVIQIPEDDEMDKNERWKLISSKLNAGHTKKECYKKYKSLKQDQEIVQKYHLLKEKITPSTTPEMKPPKEEISSSNTLKVEKETKENLSEFISRISQNQQNATVNTCKNTMKLEEYGEENSNYEDENNVTICSSNLINCIGRSITLPEVEELRSLLFGDIKKTFNMDWLHQEFIFNQKNNLRFGLIQHEGGPCGVLAVVQAFILKSILYKMNSVATWQNLSKEELLNALIEALANILWNCGDGSKCTVTLAGTPSFEKSTRYRTDGLTERIHLYLMSSLVDTKSFLMLHKDQFSMAKGGGVVLFVYSAIFSRGIQNIKMDMDGGFGSQPTLIGNHNYCTQEMVNLLLVGKACSNVFDGEKTLDGDGSDALILHGIPHQGEVGFLTLFEAYEYMVVGDYFKNPMNPIWVICSESHYSVLFSSSMPVKSISNFDLYYYDGLSRQEETIRLTINIKENTLPPTIPNSNDLVPPLNHVIQTKWKQAQVVWNDVEPIL